MTGVTYKELTISSRPESLAKVRKHIETILERTQASEREIGVVVLAYDEALANIVEHAYEGRTGIIEVSIRAGIDHMEVILRDQGEPFNPLLADTGDVKAKFDAGKDGGYGLTIIRRIMDDVRYKYENRYNVLTLIKRFPRATS